MNENTLKARIYLEFDFFSNSLFKDIKKNLTNKKSDDILTEKQINYFIVAIDEYLNGNPFIDVEKLMLNIKVLFFSNSVIIETPKNSTLITMNKIQRYAMSGEILSRSYKRIEKNKEEIKALRNKIENVKAVSYNQIKGNSCNRDNYLIDTISKIDLLEENINYQNEMIKVISSNDKQVKAWLEKQNKTLKTVIQKYIIALRQPKNREVYITIDQMEKEIKRLLK